MDTVANASCCFESLKKIFLFFKLLQCDTSARRALYSDVKASFK